ncbi:MAG: GTPase HflX, partial [candidate division NC10 bacterium]
MAETMIVERAVLVGAYPKREDPRRSQASIEELKRLTETAGGLVAETLTQRVERFDPGSLLGRGKISEVAEAALRHRARTVIFDSDLTPAQQKFLEGRLEAKIIDRTRLILDIFARRARTKEGELQVELAQLSYMLPRLTGAWRGFSQQVGGIGTRGPGERKLEYERRHIRRRIEHLKRDIERIKRQLAVQRRRRLAIPVPSVAIIGYTNVGKSTLLKALTDADILVEDTAPGTLKALGLGADDLKKLNPRLVVTSATPFGQTGPYRDYKMSHLVAWGMCGGRYNNGLPGERPLQSGGWLVDYVAGIHGAVGTAGALYYRNVSGIAQHVDVSVLE